MFGGDPVSTGVYKARGACRAGGLIS